MNNIRIIRQKSISYVWNHKNLDLKYFKSKKDYYYDNNTKKNDRTSRITL